MTDFRFDPEAHRYYLGKTELPSVSRILKPLANYPERDPEKVIEAMAWGTAVHEATEQWEQTQSRVGFSDDQSACVDAWSAALKACHARLRALASTSRKAKDPSLRRLTRKRRSMCSPVIASHASA